MKRTQLFARAAGAVVIAAALAGCGGGGGGGNGVFYPFPTSGGGTTTPPPDGGQPPVQATAYDTFVAYVVALVSTQLDNQEPANVAQFDPAPTSETALPVATQ